MDLKLKTDIHLVERKDIFETAENVYEQKAKERKRIICKYFIKDVDI